MIFKDKDDIFNQPRFFRAPDQHIGLLDASIILVGEKLERERRIREMESKVGELIPDVTFKTRVRDITIEGPNPFKWQDVTTKEYFGGKKVVLFSLPGAFTPTCSTKQLPGFEGMYDKFKQYGVDEVYCMSVNDSFVMNAWAKNQDLKNVKVIPDGSGLFTQGLNMLVQKDNLGFGSRSWRYAAVVNDCKITHWFQEPGFGDNVEDDPYGQTAPSNVLHALKKEGE